MRSYVLCFIMVTRTLNDFFNILLRTILISSNSRSHNGNMPKLYSIVSAMPDRDQE